MRSDPIRQFQDTVRDSNPHPVVTIFLPLVVPKEFRSSICPDFVDSSSVFGPPLEAPAELRAPRL
jgi:hypothetical protein